VHAIGICEHGDIDMVVDDEAGSGFFREAAQEAAFFQHHAGLGVLFAVLQYLHPGGEQGAGLFFHAPSKG
jgi:hypothetical protein